MQRSNQKRNGWMGLVNEQEILKQAWICSSVIDNSKAKSVFTMGEREVLKFARVIEREQQKRIEELEKMAAHVSGQAEAIMLALEVHKQQGFLDGYSIHQLEISLNREPTQSLAHIKRETLQRAVEICEWMADELQSSDCSDCAEAIKKEMEGIGDE